jgi:TolB-like protein/Tfp pilus assembly protein PilF
LSFIKELKRRNVFKVAIAYAVTVWILLQLTEVLTEILALPVWAPKLIFLILIVGFFPALILAWAFELTPEGVKLEKDVPEKESITRKTGRKLDYAIIISLGLSLGYFIWESRFEQKTAEIGSAPATAPVTEVVIEDPLPNYPVGDVDRNSIAVLPFANRSADAEDIYFTDGIHDDLLTQLSRIDAFSVISRTSVMEYRDTTKNLREIARELNVANVMEGSVQRAGKRVRINVQLIDAATDEHLWADIYDRELTTSNLFEIQSEIAQAIAGALEATLTDSEIAVVANAPTDNVEAYDLYLQARRFALNDSANNVQTAIALFKETLALDPEFKLAWVGLAEEHLTNYWVYGGDPVNRDLALDAIEHARRIDSSFAELYLLEGVYWYWGHLDYDRALYNLEKAINMMPGNDEAHMWRGYVSRRAGLWDQAVESMQQSLKLNPRVHFNWHEYAITLMYLHRFEDANNAVAKARALDPDNFWGKGTQARIGLQQSGDLDTAMQLTIGAQHTDEFGFFEAYMLVRIFADRFDEALEAGRNISDELEIQLNSIILREDWAAQVLHFMGREDEARQAAGAALFRLKRLRTEMGEDFRIDLAEARVSAILGADPEKLRMLVQKAMANQPADDLAAFEYRLKYARIFGIADMASEAVEILETILIPPSDTSINTVALDPAFDGISDNPEFLTMLERYR